MRDSLLARYEIVGSTQCKLYTVTTSAACNLDRTVAHAVSRVVYESNCLWCVRLSQCFKTERHGIKLIKRMMLVLFKVKESLTPCENTNL